jgi:hypothetical protein
MTRDLIGSTELRQTLANMNSITQNLKVQLDSLRITDSAGEFKRLLQNANEMVMHYDLLIVRARDDFLRAMSNLEESLDNIRETTDIVRENPSVLLRGRQVAGERIE